MKKPYRVRIRTEYIVEVEVLAANESEAEDLALDGNEISKDTVMTDIEILNIEEVEHDRFTED